MIDIIFTSSALKSVRKLPKTIQSKIEESLEILSIDWRDSRLHVKKLNHKHSLFSFRVGRDYRIIFQFKNINTIKILHAAHRKDIYNKL